MLDVFKFQNVLAFSVCYLRAAYSVISFKLYALVTYCTL